MLQRQTTTYKVKAPARENRQLLVETPRLAGWKLTGVDGKDVGQIGDKYRVPFELKGGESHKFDVVQEQTVLEELEPELEEAAATLGANRWQTMTKVIFPEILPALITGFALAFARAVGEYGSVVFIAGNQPLHSEVTPLLIITKLEQFDYRGATAIAVVMLVASFVLLFLINMLQKWSRHHQKV